MVPKIIWTAQAKNDLLEIKNFIALDSLFYAKRMIYLIYQSCKKLSAHSQIGMPLFEQDGFELRRILIKRYRYNLYPSPTKYLHHRRISSSQIITCQV